MADKHMMSDRIKLGLVSVCIAASLFSISVCAVRFQIGAGLYMYIFSSVLFVFLIEYFAYRTIIRRQPGNLLPLAAMFVISVVEMGAGFLLFRRYIENTGIPLLIYSPTLIILIALNLTAFELYLRRGNKTH